MDSICTVSMDRHLNAWLLVIKRSIYSKAAHLRGFFTLQA